MKYHVITFGCQMNKSDSERIGAILETLGYVKASDMTKADLIVVNMCSVRQSAVDRVYGLAPKFNKLKAKKILTGCVLKPDRVKMSSFFDFILDKTDLYKLPKLLSKKIKIKKDYLSIKPKHESSFLAYVPVSFGCSNFCTYCAVPYARGKLVSRSHKDILKEIKELAEKGYKEIWLLGENVNDYRSPADPKIDFTELIKQIDKIKGRFWLRFTSPHPKDFSLKMIKTLAQSPKITPYLNLPLQSGDNGVLRRMNRPYTINTYLGLIKALRSEFKAKKQGLDKELAISTDIIVGFPKETKQAFNNTKKAMEKIAFDMAYISQYSPRPQSLCFEEMKDDVPKKEKKAREKTLVRLLNKTALLKNKRFLNETIEVLVMEKNKDYLLGKTRHYKTIRFRGKEDLVGRFAKVKVKKATAMGLEGNLAKDKLLVILGPTASGKTDLAIKLAEKFNGELVSADSRLVYKEMDTGTAKPKYPHYLINIVSLKEDFNVALYKEKALKAIEEITDKGKLPILVGGTGLYIKAIVDNLDFPKIKPSKKMRKELEKKTAKQLYALYRKLDKRGARSIDKNNKRRLVRAIEVCLLSGQAFSGQRLKQEPLFDVLQIGVKKTNEELKKSIEKRTGQMIKKGLEKEAKRLLLKYGKQNPALNTIGYAEWKENKTKEQTKKDIVSNTMKFAKRQITWFKKENVKWVKNQEEAEELVKKFGK
ncbi:MAG: tRNA (N6-isopentenyl adenosine(37)-C2)-methylthiotransferase MiaB [Candidatus Paceibacterota bacterium]|jgi:tRNA-2-methylthio-N6-dimethylallyladenosine synthase|nr:tRNA (N6-isopentenyl adenosine(37)-C2)-methylthiotransferase MiaB [Candidatus Paceibacterota bacterium]MDD5555412.1 tRNA (N6-isopentenyl adenosine(37)-C2)-methylthiotransferase MiaB [Candidatus Paceibacterota bacterium]